MRRGHGQASRGPRTRHRLRVSGFGSRMGRKARRLKRWRMNEARIEVWLRGDGDGKSLMWAWPRLRLRRRRGG